MSRVFLCAFAVLTVGMSPSAVPGADPEGRDVAPHHSNAARSPTPTGARGQEGRIVPYFSSDRYHLIRI